MSQQDGQQDRRDPPSQLSNSTSASSGSDQGLQMNMDGIPDRRTQSLVAELDGGQQHERPILRLAMLNPQEKSALQARARSEQPATAPVRGATPIELLPDTGYFAPRPGISRSSSSRPSLPPSAFVPADDETEQKPKKKKRFGKSIPALRFASRDSIHTIHSAHSENGSHEKASQSRLHLPFDEADVPEPLPRRQTVGMGISGASSPPGLRRRLTQARTNLAEIGRAFNPAAGEGSTSDSDTDTVESQDTEQQMERLLDKHAANSPEHPPTNNIAANNADITSTPDFYPINPSMQNPGVIHVNMSGHDTAKNIVDSILGNIGSSTRHHKKHTPPVATPAELEAGLGRRMPDSSGLPASQSYARPDMASSGMFPGMMEEAMTPMGLGRSPTTLRGVYSNLNKLQSRMAEYQRRREQRMNELHLKEVKRKRAAEKRQREEELAEHPGPPLHEDRHRWTPRELPTLSSVGSRIRDIPDKIAGMRRAAGHARLRPTAQTPPAHTSGGETPATSSPPQTATAENTSVPSSSEPKSSFVLHGFHSMPRPESVATYLNSMGNTPQPRTHSAAITVPRTRPSTPGDGISMFNNHVSPVQSTGPSPGVSPANTPGWDEIMASSGMLTNGSLGDSTVAGGPGSRMSTASMDSTMLAFEAEKQKILAQLADIFNRQNFLLLASRALMAFGAPLHRLEANLIGMALNLDVEATFAVLPGIILITFGQEDTRSSETYVVRGTAGYDMYRLGRTNRTIRRVLKNRISVGQGVKNLERILATPPIYSWWMILLDYMIISFFICPLFWNGSWQDAGVSSMLGLMVGLLQLLAGRFNNYANLFEVSSAFLVSFVAALLQNHVCFGTVSFAGIVMLLPGLALTTSIIEMASKNMISGTVRLVFALSRCFMLGYGISVGSMLGSRVLGLETAIALMQGQVDSKTEVGNCREGPSKFWWFLFLPVLSLAFNVSISAHWRQWPFMMFSGCLAYTVSYFASMSKALDPLTPAIAAFAMGLFANILASFYNHRSAVEPILGGVQLLVPGSLGLKTVLSFITSSGTSSGSFLYNIFATSLGVAVGLFLSGMCIFPNRRKRVGLMTF
ncbi:pheromone-regulated protein prm10 [Coemansia sp. RSA 989]|nr:pheromone-regulated protein prm10 [Coemansia sp. RSA 989]